MFELSEVEKPAGEVLTESDIVPENPLRLTIRMMDTPEKAVKVGKVRLDGSAAMAKSVTLTVMLTA